MYIQNGKIYRIGTVRKPNKPSKYEDHVTVLEKA